MPFEATAQIFAFRINPLDGSLSPIPGSPFPVPDGPFSDHAAVDPSGRWLYVTVDNAAFVDGFVINQVTGALTSMGAGFPASNSPDSLVITHSGRFLYAANYGDNTISAYSINQTTGLLTALGAPVPIGAVGPDDITMDPGDRWVYTANDINIAGRANISAFTADPVTGALTPIPGSPFLAASGNASSGLVVDPSSRFLYTGNENSNDVSLFTIAANGNSPSTCHC